MHKALLIPVLFVIACIIAGCYGALHNQISYTVSPDYFHQFKFAQFHIEPALHGRLGASLVGWAASWWMGIIIGLFVVPIGLIVPGSRNYFVATMKSFAVVAVTALATGLIALVIAFLVVSPDNVGKISWYGQKINDPVAFMRAMTMHNFSYLGGMLGIITGSVFLVLQRRRIKRAQQQRPTSSPAELDRSV